MDIDDKSVKQQVERLRTLARNKECSNPYAMECAADMLMALCEERSKMSRDTAVGTAIYRACGELPEGFNISIGCENGYGGAELLWDEGRIEPDFDLPFADQINELIDHAIRHANDDGGVSTDELVGGGS